MCGRYTLFHTWAEVHAYLSFLGDAGRGRNTPPRYNIAPTQDVPFTYIDADGNPVVSEGRWWLVPHWAKELQSKYPMFNARSEDAEKKPAFRDAYRTGRCLLPASGYYEWIKGEDGGKDPWFIHLPGQTPMAFAGLWAYNKTLDVTSCTLLTAEAAPAISHVHSRMPVILEPDAFQDWLNPDQPVTAAKDTLGRNLGNTLKAYRVSREVNSTKAGDKASMIDPVE